ncbi:VWA domain-containing protein [Streptomyces bauhiniae]|uniref:VWA domain-containing protein n=1 Tax=Streptomyces bauhiniae TaxID=2340725 RepID=UPI0031345637
MEAPATAETPKAESAPATEAPESTEPEAAAAPEAETAPAAEAPVTPEPDAPEEKAAEPDPLATTAPEIEPLLMEPAILDADPEVVVPQQRTEPLPEAEAEHDQPAIPEQSTEPPTDTSAEPDTTQDTTPTPAAKAATEPKPTPSPKAEPKTEPKAEPDADAKTTPQPDTKAEPDADTKPKAKAEAKPNAGSEPEAGTAPAPEAADAPAPPPVAPADDSASRTGGAGGSTVGAEGVAEAGRLRSTPSLTTAHAAAAATLANTNLTGTAAKLYLVLDRSASMRPYYKDGSAQALADQTLALAAHLDKDPTVHVVFFSTEVDGTTDLTLTEDHATKIDETHADLGRMGRTSYHAAVEAVLAHHDKHHTPDDNVLVVFQTDGAPDAKTPATQALTNAAKTHPNVFFSFVAFGEPDNKAFDYLRKLKTGNTSFFHAGPTPRELTDTELYEGVLATWRP